MVPAATKEAEWTPNDKEAGSGGKGSGELAGDKGSKPKEEHSGSKSKDSVFRASEGNEEVSPTGAVGESGADNTVWRGGDRREGSDEVEHVEKDTVREQNGVSGLEISGLSPRTSGSELKLSAFAATRFCGLEARGAACTGTFKTPSPGWGLQLFDSSG